MDGDDEIADLDGSGNLLRRYVPGPVIDDRIAVAEGSSTTAPTLTYFHVNHQESVVAMTDASGNATGCAGGVNCQRLSYDEYGNLTSYGSATGEPYRFTGRRFDSETGLYYYQARYYSPQLGRFLQLDPIGSKDDLNLYAYTGNDPLDRTDPSGDYGEGTGWTDDTWKKFNATQQKAAGEMEKQAGKLDAKADKLDAKTKGSGDKLRAAAGNLRSGAAALSPLVRRGRRRNVSGRWMRAARHSPIQWLRWPTICSRHR